PFASDPLRAFLVRANARRNTLRGDASSRRTPCQDGASTDGASTRNFGYRLPQSTQNFGHRRRARRVDESGATRGRAAPLRDLAVAMGRGREDRGGVARQPEDVHAATGPVDDVNVAPVVDLDVVRLDDELAAVREGIGVRGRDEVTDFLRRVRLAD